MLSTEGNGVEKGGDLAAVLATVIFTFALVCIKYGSDLLLPSNTGKCAFH